MILQGSSGEPEEMFAGIRPGPGDAKQVIYTTVYAHVDVLCCRSLQATDSDGLCDPCYTIQVGDKVFDSFEDFNRILFHSEPAGWKDNMEGLERAIKVEKSLNPNFMHRFIIPLDVEAESTDTAIAEMEEVPLPPIIFTLKDKDSLLEEVGLEVPQLKILEEGMKTAPVFKVIGTAVAKKPENLDDTKLSHRSRNPEDRKILGCQQIANCVVVCIGQAEQKAMGTACCWSGSKMAGPPTCLACHGLLSCSGCD